MSAPELSISSLKCWKYSLVCVHHWFFPKAFVFTDVLLFSQGVNCVNSWRKNICQTHKVAKVDVLQTNDLLVSIKRRKMDLVVLHTGYTHQYLLKGNNQVNFKRSHATKTIYVGRFYFFLLLKNIQLHKWYCHATTGDCIWSKENIVFT